MIADISPGEIREAAAFGCANFKDDPYYAEEIKKNIHTFDGEIYRA